MKRSVEKKLKLVRTMSTNEERREVARNLRSHNESSGLFDNAFLELFHDVVGRYPDMNLFRGKCETEILFKRLADLIEPEPERTCKNIAFKEKEDGTKPVYEGIYFICSECDAYVQDSECYHSGLCPSYSSEEYQDDIKFSYCPNCGAKVVQNA